MANSDNIYFAAKEPKVLAHIVNNKATGWIDNLETTGYRQKLRNTWNCYHGAYYSDAGDGHQIQFSGEQGELTTFPVNHFRNIAQHILVMTTANRPSMEARATNTDYKSLVQTQLANNVLDYYMREKRLERYLKRAVEHAVVLGAGFIKMEWNATAGSVVDYIEEDDQEIYEGDIEFTNISPFDVIMDSTKEDQNHDWIVVRTYKNKFDLAAKYPEHADKIIQTKTKSDEEEYRIGFNNAFNETDDVSVYEFYHKDSTSIPGGRYMTFLTEDIVLTDTELPYKFLPIFRISPGDVLGTPFGYTPMFDLLPIQEAVNSLFSTVLTNQNAFGVQNIWTTPSSNLNVTTLSGSLNLIESNDKPESLQLTDTPQEIFKFIEMLIGSMETISGVNSVARGNPESSLKTGAALALVQSQALQFMSDLQQSYVELIEDIGTALIKILQDFAASKRLVAIVGENNRTYMESFNGDDIADIARVVVDVGNPLSRTTAGRVQMADNLLQYQVIQNPQQYITLINTGRLDAMTNGSQRTLNLIKAENEAIVRGEIPIVMAIDKHSQHILEHQEVISDPNLRKDAELVIRTLEHIQQHIDALRNTDPDLLLSIQEQPLQPPMMPGMPPMSDAAPGMAPPPSATEVADNQIDENLQPPSQGQTGNAIKDGQMTSPGMEGAVNMPNMPQVDGSLLPNPNLQE